jgi:hypothetical protein
MTTILNSPADDLHEVTIVRVYFSPSETLDVHTVYLFEGMDFYTELSKIESNKKARKITVQRGIVKCFGDIYRLRFAFGKEKQVRPTALRLANENFKPLPIEPMISFK